MLLLYSLVLTALGLTRWLWALRARALERAYTRFSTTLIDLAREPRKPGNGNLAEVSLTLARRQFELGRLVQKRDKLEARYLRWSAGSERFARWLEALRSWKGKKLPYTLGALDVWLALSLVDMLGFSDVVSARRVVDALVAYWQ